MQAERWDRIRDLFDEVSRQPAGERPTLLEELCPGDPEMRREVLSLLEHDERAVASFLTPPDFAFGTPSDLPGGAPANLPPYQGGIEGGLLESESDPLVGSRLGKCLIRRVIARGGMGTVYEAEQEQPRRTVAVKVMHAWAWSRAARRRFEFEVQALARLSHPHIAQIYDADSTAGGGSPEGMPYFVMEYVASAKMITDYAEEQSTDVTQRLELFLQVCDAVQYGHQKGIIHRDLKPANILVSAADPPQSPLGKGGGLRNSPHQAELSPAGCVKVIDFGVAKATDADIAATTMHTEVGQLIGTLTYMSPEQCAADPLGLDVRCDVYSLGVVLYQLLCRRLPYSVPATSLTQAARVICEEPPTLPSTIDRALRRDLEAILLKALEKERAKRYQSIADLARDIRRYLNREPVEARSPGIWNRTGRWIAKHPIWTTAGAAAAVGSSILLAFCVSLLYFGYRPHRIILQEDGRKAELVSVGGNRLFPWTSPVINGISVATLLDTPDSAGRRVALIGFEAGHPGPLRGKMCAFDAARPTMDEPLWCSAVEGRDIPQPSVGSLAEDFGVAAAWTFDVFKDVPGIEIIVEYKHVYAARALRIISLDGEVHFQAWHKGGLAGAFWMPGSDLLVVAGEDGWGYWEQRDHPDAGEVKNARPLVVFAIRPTSGFRSNQYVDQKAADARLRPVWYKCLLPPAASDVFSEPTLSLPLQASYADGQYVSLTANYRGFPGAVGNWILDSTGQYVPGSQIRNDAYQRTPGLPRMDKFYFDQLPPLRSVRDQSTE